ncbi:MAG: hypothetical protein GEU71_18720 [Actinobacteria bacterium]|nr:hypothetical protein [Actinomycetota bacterium]
MTIGGVEMTRCLNSLTILFLTLILVACAGSEPEEVATTIGGAPSTVTETEPPPSSAPMVAPTTEALEPGTAGSADEIDVGDLAGWDTMPITVGEEELLVAVADEPEERSQGLRGVDDIGDLDGMLFVFEKPRDATFVMEDTIMAIDIGFYDAGGGLVRTYQMVPCESQTCDVYPSEAAVGYALEVPADTFQFRDDAKLTDLR